MSRINWWRNTERMFNGSYGSKSGWADQYIYMVWGVGWTLAEQKHYKVAFWASINLGASGDQCPNAFLIGFHGVSKFPWSIVAQLGKAQMKYRLGTACLRIDYYGLVSHCSRVHAPWRPCMCTLNKVLYSSGGLFREDKRLKKHEAENRLKKKMFLNMSVRLKQTVSYSSAR